jgi:hypothetical protein
VIKYFISLLFVLFTVISFAQTPGTNRKAWNDSLKIKSKAGTSYVDITDLLNTFKNEVDSVTTDGDTLKFWQAGSVVGKASTEDLDDLTASNGVVYSGRNFSQKIVKDVATLEATTADSNGTSLYLVDPPGYHTQIDSAYPEEGGIAYNNATAGKQWVLADYLRTNRINTRDFGVSSSNTASANNTNMQNVFDFINALSTDSVSVFIPDGRYQFSTTFVINKTGERSLLIEGGTNTRLVQTANDTLFATTGFWTDLRLKNLYFVGNGKANTAVGLSIPATSGQLYLESCSFDTFGIGVNTYDLTGVSTTRLRLRQNGIGWKADFNVDGFEFNGNSSVNDTCFVITGSSDDYVKFTNWVGGQDSVWLVFRGGGGLQIDGGYFENVRHQAYIGTNDGNVTNGLRNVVISSTFQTGGSESGFTFYDNDRVTIYGVKATGGCDTSYFNFNTNQAVITTFGNYLSGSNMDYRFANDNVKYTYASQDISTRSLALRRQNVNGLGSTEAVDAIEVFSATDTAYISKWGVTGANDRTLGRYFYTLVDADEITFGASGKSFWDFDGGQTGAPPTASADYSGHFWYRNQSRDEPYLEIQFETGVYKWIDVLTGIPYGEGDMAGAAAFTGSDLNDTLLVTGVHNDSDYVFLTVKTASPDTSAILSYTLNTDTIFVHRQSGVISGLNYVWRRMKNRIK